MGSEPRAALGNAGPVCPLPLFPKGRAPAAPHPFPVSREEGHKAKTENKSIVLSRWREEGTRGREGRGYSLRGRPGGHPYLTIF